MADLLLGLITLAVLACWTFFILGMIRPKWAFLPSRSRVALVYIPSWLGLAVVATVIEAARTDMAELEAASAPASTPPPVEAEPAAPTVSSDPHQLPDLTHAELLEYYNRAEQQLSALADQLLDGYAEARNGGDIHRYNRWRINTWDPQVRELRFEFDSVAQQRRNQILWSDLSGLFIAPSELLLAGIQLSGHIDQPRQREREQSFRDIIVRMAEGMDRAKAYIDEIGQEHKIE